MPAKQWCLVQKSDGSIEIEDSRDGGKHWQQLKTPKGEFGAVVRMRTTAGVEKLAKKYGVEYGIGIESRTDAVVLNRQHFTWNRNSLSRKFRDCNNADEFVALFHALQEKAVATDGEAGSEEDTNGPPTKRPKVGGDSEAEAQDTKKWLDKIDYEIEQHKIGRHDLPVAQLLPPEENRILRKIDPHFVKSLKQNIKRDPTGTGVPPLVVFCNQVTRENYDSKLKDAYMYEVAGGLHSYTAKKELAEEYPHNPFYKKVEAVVYAGLSDEQALRLALRHNVNGHFVHKMTFRDLVEACRTRLFVMNGLTEPKPSPEWRTVCKTVILPECLSKGYKNEVLRLASVSTTVWDEYLQVFNMFENGELKGQTLSKKQLLTKPEIKSTQFQCLFPLDEATQITLLQQLQSKAIGMKQMHQMAQKHKRMADLKAKFCHLTNVSDWKEATRKFPTHATDRALEQFSEIDVSKATPAVFSEYCTSAVRWQTAEEPTASNILTFTHQKQLCWIIDGSPETYNPANLTALVPQFAGANLFYSYLSPGMTVEACKHLVLLACQLNAHTGLSAFNIALHGSTDQAVIAQEAVSVCTSLSSTVYAYDTCCSKPKGIGFTESLSVVIIGHWSREQKLQKEHFNFCNDAARRNVLEFDSGSIKNNPCDQKLLCVKGLLSKLISVLTYKQQCVVELFSSSACGDVAMAAFEGQRNSLLLCFPSVKECVCKRVNHFTSGSADSGEENIEHED